MSRDMRHRLYFCLGLSSRLSATGQLIRPARRGSGMSYPMCP